MIWQPREPEKLIRRTPEARLKECRPCTHSNLISNPALEPIAIKLLTKASWVGTHSFLGQEPAVSPFAWQSNKALLFYFTQNSVSEIWFGTSAEAELSASKVEGCSQLHDSTGRDAWQFLPPSGLQLRLSVALNPTGCQRARKHVEAYCSTGGGDGAQSRRESVYHWRVKQRKSSASPHLLLLWLFIYNGSGLSNNSTFWHRTVLSIEIVNTCQVLWTVPET